MPFQVVPSRNTHSTVTRSIMRVSSRSVPTRVLWRTFRHSPRSTHTRSKRSIRSVLHRTTIHKAPVRHHRQIPTVKRSNASHVNWMGMPNGLQNQWMRRRYGSTNPLSKQVRKQSRHVLSRRHFQSHSDLWKSSGMRLNGPLQPNRTKVDIFNKDYRAQIVRKYILGNLQYIGTNLKQSSNNSISHDIPFPMSLGPIFAISIRITRYENLMARLGPWTKHLTHWQGTNGEMLNKAQMVHDNLVAPRLTRGEIGCYDSHYRLWKHMVDSNIEKALILEDDADLNYGHEFNNRITKMFDDIHKHQLSYDVIYLGHNNNKRPRKMVSSCLGTPAGVQGLFMYHITLEGARKLIQGAIPIQQPADDYVYASAGHVRQFILEPRISWVVPIDQSDTATIK